MQQPYCPSHVTCNSHNQITKQFQYCEDSSCMDTIHNTMKHLLVAIDTVYNTMKLRIVDTVQIWFFRVVATTMRMDDKLLIMHDSSIHMQPLLNKHHTLIS